MSISLFKLLLKINFLCLFSAMIIKPSFALEGGTVANAGQRAGIVGISYQNNVIENCVGVILEPSKVLTSASCLRLFQGLVSAADIRVHPLLGTELGGTALVPVLNEGVPFVGVDSYQINPLNVNRFDPYNLAVLNLSTPLNIGVAKIYAGEESFVGQRPTAFGWREVERSGQILTERLYQSNVLTLPPIVDGDTNFESITDGCYDSLVDTDTVFCAGFRNEMQYLSSDDNGAPLLFNIEGEEVVIGILTFASNGFEFEGVVDYEQFSRVSTMRAFIEEQAPNTQFVTAAIGIEKPKSVISPILSFILEE